MKILLLATSLATTLLAIASAHAQAGPVGIPLGAMEFAVPGISPPPPSSTGCAASNGSPAPQATALFDGGGMVGTAGTGCVAAGSAAAAPSSPAPSGLPSGRAGIPLGSTETADPGTSPAPAPTIPFASPITAATTMPSTPPNSTLPAPSTPPCPVVGTFTSQSTFRTDLQNAAGATAGAPGC